jgi:hypothetical protein
VISREIAAALFADSLGELPMLLTALALLFACQTTLSPAQQKGAAPPFVDPHVRGVVLIILENGDPELAAGMQFLRDPHVQPAVQLGSYFAVAHPSRPNYVALVSGSTDGIHGDCVPTPLQGKTLADLLPDPAKTWKVYAMRYKGNATRCDLADNRHGTGYARRHLGFLDFAKVQQDTALCAHIIPETEDLDQLQQDMKNDALPAFALVIPDNKHNGHDAGLVNPKLGIANANHWLTETFAPLLADKRLTTDRVFIITFDENEQHGTAPNRVFIVLWGDHVLPTADATVLNATYDHYDLLRTIEALLGTGTIGTHDADTTTRPIGGIWQ